MIELIKEKLSSRSNCKQLDLENLSETHIQYMEDKNQIFYPYKKGGFFRQKVEIKMNVYMVSDTGYFHLAYGSDVADTLMLLHTFQDKFSVENIPLLCSASATSFLNPLSPHYVKKSDNSNILLRYSEVEITDEKTIITVNIVIRNDNSIKPDENKDVVYNFRHFQFPEKPNLRININGYTVSTRDEILRDIEAFVKRKELDVENYHSDYAKIIHRLIEELLSYKVFKDIL